MSELALAPRRDAVGAPPSFGFALRSASGQPASPRLREAGRAGLGHDFGKLSVLAAAPRPVLQRQPARPARRPPFDDQPPDLRRVLEDSFAAHTFGCVGGADAAECFNRLDPGARLVLVSLYNRLAAFGLWAHVTRVGGVWTTGVGGARFTVDDHVAFLDGLLKSGRFCLDTAAGGMLHPGTTSAGEISTGDSLHLSIGAANQVSAHVDAVSPAAGREEGTFWCRYEPTRAAAHIGREVVPLGVPGLQIFPEPRPTYGLPERAPAVPELIRWEVRF